MCVWMVVVVVVVVVALAEHEKIFGAHRLHHLPEVDMKHTRTHAEVNISGIQAL